MERIDSATYLSPLGRHLLTARGTALIGLAFSSRERERTANIPASLKPAFSQLDEYFAGERTKFDLELYLHGTEFQRLVWAALREIPFGETTTYGRLARRLAEETGESFDPRGVGSAVGATPVPIIVPCHRVIGADGSLTGYGGGLPRKRALLDFESTGNPAALDKEWGRQLSLV